LPKILVEIVCSSVEDALIASQQGADRIELCAALETGGLTPSLGVAKRAKAAATCPVIAMVRPRCAGFHYSSWDLSAMVDDIVSLSSICDGIITGVLNDHGQIDERACSKLRDSMSSGEFVCHRCFDVTPDPFEALERAISVGFDRILTSGQQPLAADGAELIRELIERADGRIQIMPGGGILPDQISWFIQKTGCSQVHLAPFEMGFDPSTQSNPSIRFAGIAPPSEGEFGRVCATEVSRALAIAREAT